MVLEGNEEAEVPKGWSDVRGTGKMPPLDENLEDTLSHALQEAIKNQRGWETFSDGCSGSLVAPSASSHALDTTIAKQMEIEDQYCSTGGVMSFN